MTVAVIVIAVVLVGLVWVVTIALCVSAARDDGGLGLSQFRTTTTVAKSHGPGPEGARDRRRTERRGSDERRGPRDDVLG
jgi:hypothetical protein